MGNPRRCPAASTPMAPRRPPRPLAWPWLWPRLDMGKPPKKWIKGAIKKPGTLRKSLGAKPGKNIPAAKLAAAAGKGGLLGQGARLAETLKKIGNTEATK